MKIAYLSHTEWYLRNFRLSWMKSLVSRGYTVYGVIQKKEAENYLEREGIPVIRYPIKRKSINPIYEIVTILSLYKIFKKLRPTILHTFLHKPNLYGTIAGRLAHVPIIINHIPGLGYIYTEQNGVKVKLYRFIMSRLYRHCFKYADKVIFHNEDDLNEFVYLTNDRDKFMVIKGTGVDVEFFSPDRVSEARKKMVRVSLGVSPNDIVVTMTGRLIWHKGIYELIEAAQMIHSKYENVTFLIVGWSDSGNPGSVSHRFIEDVGRCGYIKFLGKRENIRDILAITDIYVLPSYREGLPKGVLEAMAMGIPVVTTDVPGCRETVIDGVNGYLVPPFDSKKLAQALEKLILDEKLRLRMGNAGRERVLSEFSEGIVINAIHSLYEKLLDKQR